MEAPQEAIQENHCGWLKTVLLIIVLPIVIAFIMPDMLLWPAQKQQCPPVASPIACPDGWLNYEGRCYFFSEEERSWTSSQNFCASYESSLVIIENGTEKVFLLRYMGTAGHWIGLQKDPHQTWKWVDGTEINTLLEVIGETGDCAFLSTGFAMSSDCQIARKWICSRPDAYTRSKSTKKGH
ncbi:C-type lectin domain family 2 member D-like [Tiliqua scincoides]|uniref:C-type lectin domain family 2 member D-like n=1 Tax=Tiliqua scincoides TaxID=71010 RepID=UPI0034634A15